MKSTLPPMKLNLGSPSTSDLQTPKGKQSPTAQLKCQKSTTQCPRQHPHRGNQST